MARWVLYCHECSAEFTHNQIYDTYQSVSDPFASITKPEFPNGGRAYGVHIVGEHSSTSVTS